MKRNRSIRVLPTDILNPPETSPYERLYFGEEVASPHSDDSDLLLSNVRDFGSKSSSSSLSWGEDYKSEVHDELERMDRVLRGDEPIPEHYDKEEYEEWMKFFPNLCAIGTKCGVSTTTTTSSSAPASVDIDSFLNLAPLISRLGRRKSSSRSLISSHISSSKWLKDEEYESLPILGSRGRNIPPKGILKRPVVLPPIETNQFRSVSATPQRGSKSQSALLVEQKYQGFKRKGCDLYK